LNPCMILNRNIKRLAVISDFHGNYPALKAVVSAAERLACEYYLCCGDYLGYYYSSNQVIELIRTLPHTAILGNHDRDFLRLLDGEWQMTDEYKKKYGSSLEIAVKNVAKKNVHWLRSLSPRLEVVIKDRRILLCHGSPWDINEYLYPDMPDQKLSEVYALNYDIVIIGHCHYQYLKKHKRQLILNPGSVGQARDRTGASWALLELDNLTVQLRHVRYDVKEVIKETRRIDPEVPYLTEVLKRGQRNRCLDTNIQSL